MRYAILGDIHANLTALDSVLDAIEGEDVDRVIQVGDVVGYGASPRECIERLREREIDVVLGNHDGACVGLVDARTFNDNARIAVRYTQSLLTRQDAEWLATLPLTWQDEHCAMSHGTLFAPESFAYVQSPEDGDPSLDILERRVCFLGHTHRPVTLMRLADSPHRTSYTFDSEFSLREVSKALVNVGSVGQPRDDDPRAAYAIFDSDEESIEVKRIDYDIERAADKILRAGLPKMLADRLYLGI